KGGVVTFSRALAREVGAYNINVNTICPGFTLSVDPASLTEERRQYEVSSRILKRPEYPEDLVGTAIYLASADSDFMTGQAVVFIRVNIVIKRNGNSTNMSRAIRSVAKSLRSFKARKQIRLICNIAATYPPA
ncbi:SDR family oxidoreductase, partial [Chloroflexota bacterium]